MKKHSKKECVGDARVDLVTVDTRRPSYLVWFSFLCNMKIDEELNLISQIEESNSL